jgi:hypothetical protein
MEAKYDMAIEKYYQYKKKYEDERTKAKEKVKSNDNLSITEKQEKLKSRKCHCLFCNKKVNMRFYKEEYVLYAVCGDSSNPCDKRIEIKTTDYMQIKGVIDYFNDEINDFVENIIDNKTKYLLHLDDKDEVLASFEDYLELYNETNEINNNLRKKSENLYLNTQSEEIDALQIELDMHRDKIRIVTKEYNALTHRDPRMLTEISNIYKDHIMTIEDKINHLRFKDREISVLSKDYKLNMYDHLLKETETIHSVDDPEVLRFDPPFEIPQEKRQKRQKRVNTKTNNKSHDIDCEVNNAALCRLKFNDEDVDYSIASNQNFDCTDKRLTLKIHPDKNRGCEDCANDVFKIYQDKCLEK